MGKACDTLKGASEDLFHWLYPEEVTPPHCVMELLRRLYPTIDWDSVSFHKGIPGLASVATGMGVTLPSTWGLHQIHVYIGEDKWDMCNCLDLMIFVHESFHVLQYRDLLDGWGLGFLHPFVLAYATCILQQGRDNYIEAPAYAQSDLFSQNCFPNGMVCDCSTDPPGFDAARLDALVADHPDLIKTSSGFSFWGAVWNCVPGLTELWDLATRLTDKACAIDWRGPQGSSPGWGLPQNLGQALLKLFAYCGPAFLLSLLIRLLGLVYYVIWLLIMTIIVGLIYAFVVKTLIEVVILIVDGILWVATGIVCGVQWVWETIVGGFQKACEWAQSKHLECSEWGEQERLQCTETREEDVKECSQERDDGYRDCCDWWPCSWACDSWTWVSHIVCIAWSWVKHTFCVVWSYVKEKVCLAFAWVVDKATCWSK